jgi:hypothetical protein
VLKELTDRKTAETALLIPGSQAGGSPPASGAGALLECSLTTGRVRSNEARLLYGSPV